MKYQKLENQEANWKWIYLIRKHREGENITRYEERSLQEAKAQELLESQNYPSQIEEWIKNHLSPALPIKLDQAIRARRKRFFNGENNIPRKNPLIWNMLFGYVFLNILEK